VCLIYISFIISKKDKFVAFHATKAYRQSRDIVPLILNLDIRWGRPISRSGRFAPEKEPWHPLNCRLGWVGPTVCPDGLKKKKSLAPLGIRAPDHPARS